MFLLRDLHQELTADDCFAGSAMLKAIEAAEGATDDPEQQVGLVLIILAKTVGGTERKILEMVSMSEGALAKIASR